MFPDDNRNPDVAPSRTAANAAGIGGPSRVRGNGVRGPATRRADRVEGLPVELDAVAGAIRGKGEARLDAERLGDEAVESRNDI